MKNRSLLSFTLSLAILGTALLTKPQSINAAPAPIFRPLLRDIQNKLPRSLVFRLPNNLPPSTTRGGNTKLEFEVGSDRAYLAVKDVSNDCQGLPEGSRGYAMSCLRFSIASSTLSSAYYQRGNQYREGGTTFELRRNVRANHFKGDGWSIVSWIQDGVYFQIYSGSMSASELIQLARLMANDPPIYDIATANFQMATRRPILAQRTGRSMPVAEVFRSIFPQLKQQTRVPILLPSELFGRQGERFYASGRGDANGYRIVLGTVPNCNAEACSVGFFSAKRGDRPNSGGKEVRLARGITGYFSPTKYREPSQIEWVYGGVLYTIQMRVSRNASEAEATMIRLANSAIEVGLQDSQIATGRSPNTGQQTTTGRASTPVQYKDTRALGMAQFLQGKKELISAQDKLQRAVQGQYKTINIPNAEFLDNKITDRKGSGCVPLLPCPDDKKISYADYLRLKLKVNAQAQAYKNGSKIYQEIDNYRSRLESDRRLGGQDVARRLTSIVDEANRKAERQYQQRQGQVLSLGNISALTVDGFLQSFKLVGAGAKFDFDIAPAAIRVYLQAKGINVAQLESTTLPKFGNAGRFIRNIDYVVKVGEILPKYFEALLQGNDNQQRNLVLEMGSETLALAQKDRLSGGLGISPHLSKAVESYQKSQELEELLNDLNTLQLIDERDKSYINWTIQSLQWDFVSSVVLVVEDVGKSAGLGQQEWLTKLDNAHKAADSIKSALSNASDTFAEQALRDDYQRLLTQYDKNQIIIAALSSVIDSTAEEVGKYLLTARTDVVTRKPDGTIAVSADGVLYPP